MCGSTSTPDFFKSISNTTAKKGITETKHQPGKMRHTSSTQDTKKEQASRHGRPGRNKKSKSPRNHEDLLVYSDSDDSSLGSLGEINQVNSQFFLQVPQQVRQDRLPRRTSNDNARLNGLHQGRRRDVMPRSHNTPPSTTSTSGPRIRRGRIFLKPRKSSTDEW